MNDSSTIPVPANADGPRPASPGLTPRLLWCALAWFALTGTDLKSWAVGGPVVLIAAWLSRAVPAPRTQFKLRWLGVPSFLWFFAIESVRGAWDVSRRVLHPKLPIHPGFVHFTTSIPNGPARRLFTNLVSLLPGTLSARLDENRVVVHALDRDADVQAALRNVEQRVLKLVRGSEEEPA